MQIANNTVVSFHYKLQVVGGEYGEDSSDAEPMLYLHGYRGILPGLEEAMLGRSKGDKFNAELSPEQAYGPYNESGLQRVPIKHLVGRSRPKVGEIVLVNAPKGEVRATVVKVGKFNVDIDTNHPLAGKHLIFDVEIIDVREASIEEVAHRHAHGPGGHQH